MAVSKAFEEKRFHQAKKEIDENITECRRLGKQRKKKVCSLSNRKRWLIKKQLAVVVVLLLLCRVYYALLRVGRTWAPTISSNSFHLAVS